MVNWLNLYLIKGSVLQKVISNYGEGQIVIPYNFYGDGVQMNNPLGPYIQSGLENLDYITFPTLPAEFQSRLKNIMFASMFEGICKFLNMPAGRKSFITTNFIPL